MNDQLSESRIVRTVADQACHRVARKVIRYMQQLKDTTSGEDSWLKTPWDEICAQVQFEYSFYWYAYVAELERSVGWYVADLSPHEREAIWLQTEPGFDWACETPDERESYPVFDEDIVAHIVSEHVLREAGQWSNTRIRKYRDSRY